MKKPAARTTNNMSERESLLPSRPRQLERCPRPSRCSMPDAAASPARPSLTPTTSYATFEVTPENQQHRHHQQHRHRSHDGHSQRRVPSSNERGRRFSRTSESGRSSSRRFHRPSGTFILGHPTSTFEAISAYSPRVSALIVDPDDPDDTERNIAIVDDEDEDEDEAAVPYGVRKMELLQLKPITVWWGVLLISTFTALSSTTTPAVEPFLVSLFGGHSVLSSIAVMTSIAYAVFKPPMAKILDVFGRAEGLALSATLYALGYLLTSRSNSIVTFAIARLIGSAGAQGINLAQQIILADITTLASRGVYIATQFTPWLLAPWIGPPIGQLFKDMGEPGWRAVYFLSGMIVPLSCLAIILLLWTAYRRLRRIAKASQGAISALKDHNPNVAVTESLVWQPRSTLDLAREVRSELDLRGNFYLMTGCTLLLLPLSLAASRPKAWHDPLYPSLAILGVGVLGLLGYHETYVAQHPLLPPRMLKHKTVMAGCLLGASHFFCQFAYESYFPSFLQVARNYSARDASYISESYVFSATIAALICGGLIRWTKSYKRWMIFGVLLHMVGAVMMVRFRSLTTTTAEIVLSQVISGFGGGFTTLSVQLGVQAVVVHTDVAIATAIMLTITQIGGAVGGAVSGVIWTTWLPPKLRENLPNATPEELSNIFGSMSVALSYAPGSPERSGIDKAYFDVQRMLNLAALLGLIPAFLSAILMDDVRMGHERSADKVGTMPMGHALHVNYSDDEEDTGSSEISYEHSPLRRSMRR